METSVENQKVVVAFRYDEKGIYKFPVEHKEGTELDAFTTFDNPLSKWLFVPKWNGSEWIEGETQEEREEREALALLDSLKPTLEQLADADLEIKVITLLMDMGVI